MLEFDLFLPATRFVDMTKKSCFAAILFILAVSFLCTTAEARRWTDIDGNEVVARFVRVSDGVVYLKKGTRVIEVPFDKFSEEDQEHIRGVVTKFSKEKEREWLDNKGRRTKATFVRLEDGKAVLLRKDREISVSISSLSNNCLLYTSPSPRD